MEKKIGMELFYAEGPEIVREIKKRGHQIFLDLKLHDIPNTVKGGMKNLANLGVDIVNVHCAGGIAMMKAAIDGLNVKSIDTTGAGDSFIGGVVRELNGDSISEAIEFGTKVSAIAVTKKGAQTSIPTIEEVIKFKGG